MKRYTPKTVSKWLTGHNRFGRERKPHPFPGKTPTRLMLNAIAGKRRFTYFGKPSKKVLEDFEKFSKLPIVNKDFHLISIEFDKAGMINFGKNGFQGPSIRTNEGLWLHYHPEVGPSLLPTWLNWKYKVVNGVYRID